VITVPSAYSEVPATESNPEMTGFIRFQDESQGQQQQPSYFGGCSQVTFCQPAPAYASHWAVNDRYKNRQSIFIGAAQIIIGLLCITFNATGIGIGAAINVVSYGIWGGVLMIIAGCFGIAAGKRKTKCPIITFLVMSIISACAAAVILALGILGAMIDRDEGNEFSCKYHYSSICPVYYALVAMNILLAILGGIGGFLSIWGSILGCMSCCCQTTYQIQWVPTNGAQQVYIATPPAVSEYTDYPGYPMQNGPNGQMQMTCGPNGQMQMTSGSVFSAPPLYQPAAGAQPGQVNNAFLGDNMEKVPL
jgi:hypothetical protein